jgi:hypothetical protein
MKFKSYILSRIRIIERNEHAFEFLKRLEKNIPRLRMRKRKASA